MNKLQRFFFFIKVSCTFSPRAEYFSDEFLISLFSVLPWEAIRLVRRKTPERIRSALPDQDESADQASPDPADRGQATAHRKLSVPMQILWNRQQAIVQVLGFAARKALCVFVATWTQLGNTIWAKKRWENNLLTLA